jgi:HD-like signal output (HDOD) protein
MAPTKLPVKPATQALSFTIPTNPTALIQCTNIVQEPNFRVNQLALAIREDPAIVLDLFHQANSVDLGAGRQPLFSIDAAITRLGDELMYKLLKNLKTTEDSTPPELIPWIEINRERGRKIAHVSAILADICNRTATNEAYLAGLFCCVGEILAVLHLGAEYVQVASGISNAALQYKLVQDFKFDTHAIGVQYLHRRGIPASLIIRDESETASRDRRRSTIKVLIHAAEEFVEAAERGRLGSYAPGKNLPSQSKLRVLQLQGNQYENIFAQVKATLQ